MSLDRIASLELSAASGLVAVDDGLFVVADDELVLTQCSFDGEVLDRVRLFAGTLPDDAEERKQAKPDLEALVALADGSLLALGSGSKKNRDRGLLVRDGGVQEIDLEPLYDALRRDTDRLNVEGAAVLGMELVLLTRRTGRRGRNTLVRLDLRRAMSDVARGRLGEDTLLDVHEVELGACEGIPFGFGDGTPWRGGLLFTAAAEDTDDPVDDGVCVGAQIGWLDGRGLLQWTLPIDPPLKLEGITSTHDGRIYVVSDADDRAIAAQLYRVRLDQVPASVRTTG